MKKLFSIAAICIAMLFAFPVLADPVEMTGVNTGQDYDDGPGEAFTDPFGFEGLQMVINSTDTILEPDIGAYSAGLTGPTDAVFEWTALPTMVKGELHFCSLIPGVEQPPGESIV